MDLKKLSQNVTFLLNLLAALPFSGIAALAAAFLLSNILKNDLPPHFVFIQAVILDILFISLWGAYQYRVICAGKVIWKKFLLFPAALLLLSAAVTLYFLIQAVEKLPHE